MTLDTIRVDDLDVECVIGILADERHRLQPIKVAIDIRLDVTSAGVSGEMHRTVDYCDTARAATFILEHGRFRMLESAALAICHYTLLGSTLTPEEVKITLVKPEALGGRGVPSLSVTRRVAEVRKLAGGALWRSPDAVLQLISAGAFMAAEPGYPTKHELALTAGTLRISTP